MNDVTNAPIQAERRPYRRLWRDWLRRHRARIALGFVLMLVVAAASAGYAKVIQSIIDAFSGDPQSVIWWGPTAVLALAALKSSALYAQSLIDHDVRIDMESALKKAMFAKLVHADLAQLQTEAPAGMAARFTSDINLIGAAVGAIFSGLLSVLTVIAAFVVMLSIDWQMTAGIAVVFFAAVYPVGRIGQKLRRISHQTQRQISHMSASVTESLAGIRMIRTYQLETQLEDSAGRVFEDLRKIKARARSWEARILPMMELIGGFSVAVLLLFVAWRLSRGTTSVADFMGLLTGLGVAVGPARGISRNYAVAQQGAGALERVFGLLDARNEIADAPDAFVQARVRGNIAFRHVVFAYPGGASALQDVSFEIEAGSRVAFVGRSGAGKSTIFNLLPRLFDVTSGTISLDGTDIRGMTLASLRSQFALVGQDSVLLAGSVAENIGFGQAGATPAAIARAATAAAADGFISAQPEGYQTFLNMAGAGLSGGEKQRLSIARAILRDAPILLLDEPTSALDAESEEAIRQALERLAGGRTTLVIAHRLATIMDADKIFVLDQGRIVDQGKHEELLERGGLYADLCRLQFKTG